MSRKISTREWVGIVVIALAGLYFLYTRGGGGTTRSGGAAGLEALDISDPPVVEMASLQPGGAPYDSEGRSLFKYYTPPPPKPKPRPQVKRPEPPKREPTPVPPMPKQPQRDARNSGPPPPTPNFKYLGFFGEKDNKIAVFEDKDDIMLAQAGDVVQDKFIVRDFKYEGVVLGFTEKRWEGQTTELPQLNVDKKGR